MRCERTVAVVEVSDNGPGLPEHERAVLFGDRPITQLRHSTGLGLWLTKWILDCHGGELAYDRHDGRTTLTLQIPLAAEVGVGDNDRRGHLSATDERMTASTGVNAAWRT